ncbi:hypothetical protein CHS0354_016591 [Potamilus streckersoni]|uniref:Uncharacterized protein n=1 Tax=Potamilus streckersoni TaxID=2493646 RepID=A0AAE0TN87_9BIVA|nr:hypothetical protein CHS0354_016591 [Potamilus streckersoni]
MAPGGMVPPPSVVLPLLYSAGHIVCKPKQTEYRAQRINNGASDGSFSRPGVKCSKGLVETDLKA